MKQFKIEKLGSLTITITNNSYAKILDKNGDDCTSDYGQFIPLLDLYKMKWNSKEYNKDRFKNDLIEFEKDIETVDGNITFMSFIIKKKGIASNEKEIVNKYYGRTEIKVSDPNFSEITGKENCKILLDIIEKLVPIFNFENKGIIDSIIYGRGKIRNKEYETLMFSFIRFITKNTQRVDIIDKSEQKIVIKSILQIFHNSIFPYVDKKGYSLKSNYFENRKTNEFNKLMHNHFYKIMVEEFKIFCSDGTKFGNVDFKPEASRIKELKAIAKNYSKEIQKLQIIDLEKIFHSIPEYLNCFSIKREGIIDGEEKIKTKQEKEKERFWNLKYDLIYDLDLHKQHARLKLERNHVGYLEK